MKVKWARIALCVVLVSSCAADERKQTPQPTQQRPNSNQTPRTTTTTTTKQQQQQATTTPAPLNLEQLAAASSLSLFYQGVEKFALQSLQRLASTGTNVAFSPLTTWVVLALLSEGATGRTKSELCTTLSLPDDINTLHQGFGEIRGDIMRSVGGNSSLDMGSAIFTSPYQSINLEFERIAESFYNTTLETVSFRNRTQAAMRINSWVYELTKGNIPSIVEPRDLIDAEMVLASALYFRGTWKESFNESQTRSEPFYDEDNQKVSDVQMMYQVGNFRMSFVDSLESVVLELPYSSERNSMLLILPRRSVGMKELLDKIVTAEQPFVASIMHKLRTEELDDDTHIYVPRFKISSDIKLTDTLKKMGIEALFQGRRELTGLSPLNLYVSQVIHKAVITVAEQGTVAAAVSAATLHNYNLPSSFKANHPFLYMIVQKATNTILFAGKVGNPAE